MLTETVELPGVVPYPDEGNDANDHRLPSPALLIVANAKFWLGDILGLSKGLPPAHTK